MNERFADVVELSDAFGNIVKIEDARGHTVWMYKPPKCYEVNLNGQWQEATVINPDANLYDMYESYSNKGVNSSYASVQIKFRGCTSFTVYINSYAESYYDYTVAFSLDHAAPTSLPADTTPGVVANTRDFQKDPSGSVSSNYKAVTYNNDGGEHYIWITYRKDPSTSAYNDRGYILIPKNQ